MSGARTSLRVMQIVAAPASAKGLGVNGPERRAASLLPWWASYGIEPLVVYPRRGRLWGRFEGSGVPLIDFEIGSKFRWDRILSLRRLARERAVDVVHTQGPGSVDGFATLAAKALGIPVIVTRPVMMEDLVNVSWPRRELYRRLDRLTLRFADRVIAVSEAGRRHLERAGGVTAERLAIAYNGVDLSRFRPWWEHGGHRRRGSVTLGMVAQLTGSKGWFDFVSLIERLTTQVSNLRAIIIGDGPLRDVLGEIVRDRGLAHAIELVGYREDVECVLGDLDVFVLTSHREGLPMAILEAMACGLPVVATDVGAVREQVVEGETGFVVPPRDTAAALDRCLRLIESPALRDALGRAGRRRVEACFNERAMAARYAHAYRAVARPEISLH